METGQRGFIITGEDVFLQPFNLGVRRIGTHVEQLRNQVDENPQQYQTIEAIDRLIQQWLDKAGLPEIEARLEMNKHPESLQDLSVLLQNQVGRNILDELKYSINTLIKSNEMRTDESLAGAKAAADTAQFWTIFLTVLAFIVSLIMGALIIKSIIDPLLKLSSCVAAASQGNLDVTVKVSDINNEIDRLGDGFNHMISNLKSRQAEAEHQAWLDAGSNKLNEMIRGEQSITEFSQSSIQFLSKYVDASIGAFYVVDKQNIKLTGSYAFKISKGFVKEFAIGEGLVGQAALNKKTLTLNDVPESYFSISSGLGSVIPRTIVVIPIIWNNKVVAILEFGLLKHLSTKHESFIEIISTALSIGVNTALSRSQK